MKNQISMTKMLISMTFKRIFPDLQAFQAWNQQVQISKTFQIFMAPYEPCVRNHQLGTREDAAELFFLY
jgi:hypothetical protein